LLFIFKVGLSVVRLIVWLILFHVGIDFWIFPNMNDDSLGIIASFIPIYSFDWREDDSSMVIIRIVSAVSLVYFVHQLSQEP